MQPGPRSRGLTSLAQGVRASVGEPLLSVLFPPRCVGCGDFETHLCEACQASLAATGGDACPRCGEPGPQALLAGRCTSCMGREFEYAGAHGAFRHQGVARNLVAKFKFGGQPVLGRVMAELARPAFDGFVDSIGARDRLLVTWVPCHRSSQRERGYNQAEVLARQLACGPEPLAWARLVRKTKATKHQKSLGRAGRQENLRGVFCMDVTAPLHVVAHTDAVILVDDVFTTGATAREVSSVLRKGIGLPVHVFTFSRAVAGTPERHD
jgi:predicted amidophosphoribosyltransferase